MSKINSEGFLELSGVVDIGGKEFLNAGTFPVLKGLTPLSLRLLNQSSKLYGVAKGVEIIRAGDSPHDIYFIASGSIIVGKMVKGELKPVATLKAGDFFGEYGALRGKTREASVFAGDSTAVVRVDNKVVQQVIGADSDFSNRLNTIMKERMLSSYFFSSAIFKDTPASSREWLAKKVHVTAVQRVEEIFKEGDKGGYHYIVISGEVDVVATKDKQELLIEKRRGDSVLGETRQGEVYAYTARAVSSVDLLVLDKNMMQMFQQTDPNTIQAIKQALAAQTQRTTAALNKAKGG